MASLPPMTQFAGGLRHPTDDPKEAELKKLSFLTAGLILASFHAGTAQPAPDWTIHYNVKYGVSDQETADLYLLNTASIPPSYSSMAVPGRPVIRFLAVC